MGRTEQLKTHVMWYFEIYLVPLLYIHSSEKTDDTQFAFTLLCIGSIARAFWRLNIPIDYDDVCVFPLAGPQKNVL